MEKNHEIAAKVMRGILKYSVDYKCRRSYSQLIVKDTLLATKLFVLTSRGFVKDVKETPEKILMNACLRLVRYRSWTKNEKTISADMLKGCIGAVMGLDKSMIKNYMKKTQLKIKL